MAIDGRDLASAPEPAKAGFGLAIDPPELPAALTGRQYLQLVASIRGCTENDWPGVEVVERLGLRRWLERPIAEYSLGTQAKIAIAAALLGAPPLLIFDESLNGLDPLAAFEVKRIIRAIALRGQPRGHHLHPYRGSRSRPLQPRGASGRGQHCPRVGCPAVGRGKPRARRF
ncbi:MULTISPECIES: ATP-binding cassette domain-containing protein [unclassified Mesorhizobium]|uniref:ATP-binding cassette domain-containing protein n=1 Tax=unclassified Mesorhizobium TaxID=325217 RepID=UPI001FDECF3E|nr:MULTISPECIES: ATP-binding cassette domain-containing protein [unclassified Mesorhizobium]